MLQSATNHPIIHLGQLPPLFKPPRNALAPQQCALLSLPSSGSFRQSCFAVWNMGPKYRPTPSMAAYTSCEGGTQSTVTACCPRWGPGSNSYATRFSLPRSNIPYLMQ